MEKRKRAKGLEGICLGLILALLTVTACSETSEEKRIHELITRAVELAERSDAASLADQLTADFNLNMPQARGANLRLVIKRGLGLLRQGQLYYPRPTVDIDGDLASASFPFVVIRGERRQSRAGERDLTEWMGEVADKTRLMRIHLDLRKAEGVWKFSGAVIERFTPTGFRRLGGA